MSSKSQQVRSKKEKMNDKRQSKSQYPGNTHRIQSFQMRNETEVISSDSDIEVIEQKPTKKVQQKVEIVQRPNNINFDRIKKVTGPIINLAQPTILRVQESTETLNEIGDENRTINYKKQGSKNPHKTCGNFLKTRLVRIEEQEEAMIEKIEARREKQQLQKQEIQQNEQVQQKEEIEGLPVVEKTDKIQRFPRYFDEDIEDEEEESGEESMEEQKNKSIKCFRCGSKGHIARMCDQQSVMKCAFCLGNHHQLDCHQKLCRNCNKKGHMKQDCTQRVDKIKCNKCFKYGHVMRNCGRIVMINFKSCDERQIRERYGKEDLERLKCLKCNGSKDSKGHFNCKEYHSKVPKVYG